MPRLTYAVSPGLSLIFRDLGVQPADVFRRAGLPDNLLAQGAVSLEARDYFALWQSLEDLIDAPNLPLLIGKTISAEVFDPAIFAALCSPDLDTAAGRIARYKKLIAPMRVAITRTTEQTTIRLVWPPHPAPPPGFVLVDLIFWVSLARMATRDPIVPLRLSVPVLPRDRAAYREHLGVDLTEGEPAVVFSAADATRPFLTANPQLWSFFEPELRRRLAELESGAKMAAQVRSVLLELLPAGSPSMEAVCKRLRVSSRTLQRRLRSEGTTFKGVLNATREDLARHYLRSSALSAAEIAFLLGYENPSSFYRAFHAWTGQTPETLRGQP